MAALTAWFCRLDQPEVNRQPETNTHIMSPTKNPNEEAPFGQSLCTISFRSSSFLYCTFLPFVLPRQQLSEGHTVLPAGNRACKQHQTYQVNSHTAVRAYKGHRACVKTPSLFSIIPRSCCGCSPCSFVTWFSAARM